MYLTRKQLGYTAAFFAIIMLLGLFMGLMAAIGSHQPVRDCVAFGAMIATPFAAIAAIIFCFGPDW